MDIIKLKHELNESKIKIEELNLQLMDAREIRESKNDASSN